MSTNAKHVEHVYISDENPGAARWRLSILSAGHGVTHMQGAVLPLIYPLLMNSMGFGYVELGAMLTFTRLVNGFLQGIWGIVSRYVSGRNLIVMENVGVGLGIGLCGIAHNFLELTGLVTIGQIAASPHHPIGSAMLSKWFSRKKRGAAQAIHFATANVATVVCPFCDILNCRDWLAQNTLPLYGTRFCRGFAATFNPSIRNVGRQIQTPACFYIRFFRAFEESDGEKAHYDRIYHGGRQRHWYYANVFTTIFSKSSAL
ncbi:MFS transporter [Alicyclobacillus suci]|uniref:MFS transporter n=1 Tax=Alicyclobacillus suci TaxID=2816080 RepID=UPI001F4766B7|nr:MFS transporter [Alicyclobacillus suci]